MRSHLSYRHNGVWLWEKYTGIRTPRRDGTKIPYLNKLRKRGANHWNYVITRRGYFEGSRGAFSKTRWEALEESPGVQIVGELKLAGSSYL